MPQIFPCSLKRLLFPSLIETLLALMMLIFIFVRWLHIPLNDWIFDSNKKIISWWWRTKAVITLCTKLLFMLFSPNFRLLSYRPYYTMKSPFICQVYVWVTNLSRKMRFIYYGSWAYWRPLSKREVRFWNLSLMSGNLRGWGDQEKE